VHKTCTKYLKTPVDPHATPTPPYRDRQIAPLQSFPQPPRASKTAYRRLLKLDTSSAGNLKILFATEIFGSDSVDSARFGSAAALFGEFSLIYRSLEAETTGDEGDQHRYHHPRRQDYWVFLVDDIVHNTIPREIVVFAPE
jgi:hypothetical protein